jgi:hypothetical protein
MGQEVLPIENDEPGRPLDDLRVDEESVLRADAGVNGDLAVRGCPHGTGAGQYACVRLHPGSLRSTAAANHQLAAEHPVQPLLLGIGSISRYHGWNVVDSRLPVADGSWPRLPLIQTVCRSGGNRHACQFLRDRARSGAARAHDKRQRQKGRSLFG